MRRMIVVALAVLGVCMAATASASAHLFHATAAPGTLLGLQTSNQIFTTEAGGKEVICKHATTTGTIKEKLGLHQLVEVVYTECTVAGFTADISPAQYLFSADGLAAIENTIVITALIPFVGCSIKVGPQDLGTVKYENKGTEIIETSSVKGIVSTGSGGECGGAHTGGTYEGTNLIMEAGAGNSLNWL